MTKYVIIANYMIWDQNINKGHKKYNINKCRGHIRGFAKSITRNFDSFKWQIYKQILISQFCLYLIIHIQ